jgi:multidrug efflux pump subunit AcrA (membrane-fusion protein)
MRIVNQISIMAIAAFVFIVSCKGTREDANDENNNAVSRVLVTHVRTGQISKLTELNATSIYLKEHWINAPVSGYITKAHCTPGTLTAEGDILFEVKTREAKALGQSTESITGRLDLKGTTEIRANISGYLAQVFHQEGDFVTEGESLVNIKDTYSLIFILNLPYEWNHLVSRKMPIQMVLPDNRKIRGEVTTISPVIEPASQTQKVYIKLLAKDIIPEGLVAKVILPLITRTQVQILPRSSVLSNETETEFWVMKMINDSVAMKVPVQTGIQNRDSLEITDPVFSPADEILSSGNYAIPDTFNVKVIR